MKKTILISLILIIGLSACKKEKLDDNTDTIDTHISAEWLPDRDITSEYNTVFQEDIFKITNGDFLVFKYTWSKPFGTKSSLVHVNKLIFKIPSYLQQFEYTDEKIMKTACFYSYYGGTILHKQNVVKTGSLKGVRQANGDWEITATVWTTPKSSEEEPIKLEFNRTFSEDDN